VAENVTDNPDQLRQAVRKRYAQLARGPHGGGTCCGQASSCSSPVTEVEASGIGASQYGQTAQDLPEAALAGSLGCGNPTSVAELAEGEVVLDLGSGAGLDVFLSARRVGPTGKAYGLDMTDEMLELARANQQKAAVNNVEWLRGTIEEIPLPDRSVDVVISNCVINLSADKARVLREAARLLRPGGRFAVTDIVADEQMDAATRQDMQAFTGCIAGALTPAEFEAHLAASGFVDIEICETHRVHPMAGSAVIRARKPY
jgi:arsenite methyltransferase